MRLQASVATTSSCGRPSPIVSTVCLLPPSLTTKSSACTVVYRPSTIPWSRFGVLCALLIFLILVCEACACHNYSRSSLASFRVAGLLCDLLWSDPDKDIDGWGENDRGVSYTFGGDIVTKFLNKHDLDLVCRAHQVLSVLGCRFRSSPLTPVSNFVC